MGKKAKILYLSYDGMTDPLGQSQVLPYLSGLSKKGYDFHLISFEKPERFDKHKDVIQGICDDAGIKWHPLNYTKRPPVISTWRDVRKLNSTIMKLHSQQKFDVVHCRSYITALSGLKLKRNEAVPFVFDMRGFWADERVDGNIWNLSNVVFRTVFNFFKKKEIEFMNGADVVVSLTNRGKNEILSWKDKLDSEPQIEVIPCCADLEVFNVHPEGKDKDSKFTIGYLGAIGTWYMLDEMLDFFKVVKIKYPEAIFHFLTKENADEIFKKAKEKQISTDSIKIEPAERTMIPELTKNWNYSIFFIRPTFSKKASSPTKMGELMGMGIPIICNTGVGDVDLVVEDTKCGVSVDTFSEVSYKAALDELISGKYEKQEIRQGALKHFNLNDGIEKYKAIYAQLHK